MAKKNDNNPSETPPPENPENKTPPPPENRIVKPSMVKVRVLGQAVGEDGGPYTKGQTFEVTPERRKALGDLVADAPAE